MKNICLSPGTAGSQGKGKVKSAPLAHNAGACSGFRSIKWLGVFLHPPWMEC